MIQVVVYELSIDCKVNIDFNSYTEILITLPFSFVNVAVKLFEIMLSFFTCIGH